MAHLTIKLLGSFQASLMGKVISGFDSDKVRALLVYLAVEADQPHRREKLAGLLWPDFPERSARTSLRRALANLRYVTTDQTTEPPFLLITRQTIQFNRNSDHDLDVHVFKTNIKEGIGQTLDIPQLNQAMSLYQGSFLEGFSIPDSSVFEEWALVERETLHGKALRTLHNLAGHYQEIGVYDRALQFARRQLLLDPYQEAAHQQVLWILALTGQRNEALAHYSAYRQLLKNDLGVAPLKQTRAMYERLLDGELPAPPVTTVILKRESRVVGECPYRGLAAFQEKDAPFFFGRDEFTKRLIEAVNQRSLVAVIVGASGAGKSSTVFAGLLPRLKEQGTWLSLLCRPRDQPFHSLAAAILPILEPELSETDYLIETRKLAEALSNGELSLQQVVDQALEKYPSAERVLLIIDQFEELYTLCTQPDLPHRYLDMLLSTAESWAKQRVSPIFILLTLRADFMGQALNHRPFADVIQEGSLILGPMNCDEQQKAVEKPAEKQGAAFEAGLVSRILDDVGEEPGNLPLLEFALTLLWDRMDQGWMTHAAYEEIGRVDGALARYAEEVYEGLDSEEQNLARRIFIQLIQPGEGTEDTRRVTTHKELGEKNWHLVKYLADLRLVVTGRDAAGQGTVEVVHEALIRGWHRLQIWIDLDRTFRMWQESLRIAVQGWITSSKDDGALLRGVPLSQAESWLRERGDELSKAEITFIQTSVELRSREQVRRDRRRRRTIIGLVAGLVVALILVLLAGQQWQRAEQQARTATARELAAASVINLDVDPERSILLALEAVEITYGHDKTVLPEAEDALHRALRETRVLYTLSAANAGVFSPDSSHIATGSSDGTVTIWDAQNGESLQILDGHSAGINNIAYSWDGNQIATTSDDLTAKIWDAKTGDELLTLRGHENALISPVFSPDGRHLATSSFDGTVRVWDLHTGEVLWIFSHTARTGGVDFSPDGVHLAVAVDSSPGVAIIWDIVTGQEVLTMTGYADGVNDIVFNPDGTEIATVSSDGNTKIRDLKTGEVLQTLYGHSAFIFGVDISADGLYLATGGQDGTAIIWDYETGQELLTLSGHTSGIDNVSFSPDGNRLSTDSVDGSVKVWDITLEGSREWFSFTGHESLVFGLDYSPDGEYLATVSWDGTAKVWGLQTGHLLHTLTGHLDRLSGVDFSPDGSKIATSSYDGTVKVWDSVTGSELLSLAENMTGVFDVTFSPDGTLLATGNGDGSAVIWDSATGRQIQTFNGHGSWIFDLAFSPDGTQLATAGWDGQVTIWDVANGQPLLTITGHAGQVNSVAFDPTGELLVTSSWDMTAMLWDLTIIGSDITRLDTPLLTLDGHNALVWDATFNPDGSRIATVAFNGNIKIWEAETGQELLTLGNEFESTEIVFSPDGTRLATGGQNATVHILALNIVDLITLAEERLSRGFTDDECRKYLRIDNCPSNP